MSWTKVQPSKFPHQHSMACCKKRAQVGEIVITVPVRRDGVVVGTGIIHSRCMLPFLENVPEDLTILQEKADKIIAKFKRSA